VVASICPDAQPVVLSLVEDPHRSAFSLAGSGVPLSRRDIEGVGLRLGIGSTTP